MMSDNTKTPQGDTWSDVAVVTCTVGSIETMDLPAIRFRVLSGREHEFCFSTVADLARLGDLISRQAEHLAAIAAAASRPN